MQSESFRRCKVCGIPDFMALEFFNVKDEGYCDEHVPKEHDPKEKLRQVFDKFFKETK